MKKVLFLDRDGTLILEPEDYVVDGFEKVQFYPEIFFYLSKIVRELDYELVMITNQDGLGTPIFPEEKFRPAHDFIVQCFADEGIHFREILIDVTFPEDNAPTRKPGTALLTHYLEGDFDLANSLVVGDRLTDMELAKNLGAKGIWLDGDPELGASEITIPSDHLQKTIVLRTQSWAAIYKLLKGSQRQATVHRKTKETDVYIELQLDGAGKADCNTGLGFFDHMLDQIARHSGCNLTVKTKGDLHIDEHHTVEDTALALGQAFKEALGDKRGIERYGFCLPMDDCQALVSLDFGGRPWLVWDAEFKREMVGTMPTELFSHFFKSFSDTALANIHIQAEGQNEHHKIEAIFKAFARSLKAAIRQDPFSQTLPSTKGTL